MSPTSLRLLGLLAAVALLPSGVGAQDEPSLRARRTGDVRIAVDGVLDEAVWGTAAVAAAFRQREPVEGADATERTEVRVVYDRETVYVGVYAYHADPDAVIARILHRDKVMQSGFDGLAFGGDDAVAIVFDPFHDHRNGVIFATNPNGAEFDALLTDEG